MGKISSIKQTIFQTIYGWCYRICFCFALCVVVCHFKENRSGMIILSIISLLILFLIEDDEILIYDDFFIFQKKYFFNLIRLNKKFNYSDILETDASGTYKFPNNFFIVQNDKAVKKIGALLYLRELEKAKVQINKQIEIYKKTKEKFFTK